jgi:hypothetical protein
MSATKARARTAQRDLPQLEERPAAGIARGVAEVLLDAQQLVVLRDALERDREPVLICPALVPTAMSAIMLSSVSPERCETTQVYPARLAIVIAENVSDSVPI